MCSLGSGLFLGMMFGCQAVNVLDVTRIVGWRQLCPWGMIPWWFWQGLIILIEMKKTSGVASVPGSDPVSTWTYSRIICSQLTAPTHSLETAPNCIDLSTSCWVSGIFNTCIGRSQKVACWVRLVLRQKPQFEYLMGLWSTRLVLAVPQPEWGSPSPASHEGWDDFEVLSISLDLCLSDLPMFYIVLPTVHEKSSRSCLQVVVERQVAGQGGVAAAITLFALNFDLFILFYTHIEYIFIRTLPAP